MQLTSQDKKAAREGFAYVVVRGGKRVCYASTLAEAKRECGSKGKVVSISGMRYTAQNPSSGAKQRARGTRSYGKGLFVEADLSGRHARMLDKAAGIRRKSAKLGSTYTKLMHRDALAEAARVRNPLSEKVVTELENLGYSPNVYSTFDRPEYEYYVRDMAKDSDEPSLYGGFATKEEARRALQYAVGLGMHHLGRRLAVQSKLSLVRQSYFPNSDGNWVWAGQYPSKPIMREFWGGLVRNPSLNVRNPSVEKLPVVFRYSEGDDVFCGYASTAASATKAAKQEAGSAKGMYARVGRTNALPDGKSHRAWVVDKEYVRWSERMPSMEQNPSLNVRNPAAMTKSDKAVIIAFTDHRPASGKKLSTDGNTLNGHWMGGDGIAHWRGDKIHFTDLGSVAAQRVQRAVAKEAPRNWLARNPSHRLLPSLAARNPARGGTKYYLYTGLGPIYYQPLEGRFNSKKQAVAYAKMAYGVDMALPMFHKAKVLSSRELAAKQTRVRNPSLNVR